MLVVKAVIYRVIRILLLLVVSFLVLGNIGTALSISAIDAIVATLYYYFFDKYWIYIEKTIKKVYLKFKYRKFK